MCFNLESRGLLEDEHEYISVNARRNMAILHT